MSIEQNDARRLDLIADALDDAFLAASDEEILEDAKAAGLNTAAEATRVKGMLLAAVQRVQKRNLVAVEKQLRYLRRKAEKRAMKEGVVTTEPLGEKPKPRKPAIADGGKEMKRWKV